MKSKQFAGAVAAVVAFAAGAACSDSAAALMSPPPPGASPEVVSFVNQMNAHRQSEGCDLLAWHGGVASVATAHSQDMVDRAFFSHTNPDGKSPFDRLDDAGVTWNGAAGENIAAGTSDAGTVLSLWLNSPGHRANIENCTYTHHGVGLVEGRWTHLFVTNPD